MEKEIFDIVGANFNTPSPNPIQSISSPTKIIQEILLSLPNLYKNIAIDEWVIMPNHLHFVITFFDIPVSKSTSVFSNLSKIIKYFKSKTTIEIKKYYLHNSEMGKCELKQGELKFAPTVLKLETIWQKSFYDHIIRGEKDMNRVREYILNNPLKWKLDKDNFKNVL